MSDLTVTKINIRRRKGANGAPSHGDAIFSDGKHYEWSVHPIDGYVYFFTERLNPGLKREIVTFRSAKRESAIRKEFE